MDADVCRLMVRAEQQLRLREALVDREIPATVDVWVGVDVGKKDHHAVALDASGKVLFDRSLPQDEQHLQQLITGLKAHGSILFVVDQPATIGALPLAVARDEGVQIGYLPGLAMRRIADLHSGEAKTDLLTELPDRIRRASPLLPGGVARLRAHGQRQGCAAGVVAVGGTAARVA